MAWGRKGKGSKEKDADDAGDARSSIIAAFWKLLDTYQLDEVTVSLLASTAHCGKPTFLYNFSSVQEVGVSAVMAEFPGEQGAAQDVFRVLSSTSASTLDELLRTERWQRVMLLVRRGGRELVQSVIVAQTDDLWRDALCPDGDGLCQDARSIAEFLATGCFSVICNHHRATSTRGATASVPTAFLSEAMRSGFEEMCLAQGASTREVAIRLWGPDAVMMLDRRAAPAPADGAAAPAEAAAGAEGSVETCDK